MVEERGGGVVWKGGKAGGGADMGWVLISDVTESPNNFW